MDKLTKTAIITASTLTFLVLSGLGMHAYRGRIEYKMQTRQNQIIQNMNNNPLTRISDQDEFWKIYRKEEANYDAFNK